MVAEIKYTRWHHAPPHLFVPGSTYFVTAGTYCRAPFFASEAKMDALQDTLFMLAQELCWSLEAWALFANHYHLVARASGAVCDLARFIRSFHSRTAKFANQQDRTPGRRVWYQYWDTCITNERSYYARLNYVHNNPVKHSVVGDATLYSYCSARWFMLTAAPTFYKTVTSFPTDRLRVIDDF